MSRKTTVSPPNILNQLRTNALELHAYLDILEQRFQDREPDILACLPEKGRFERIRLAADQLLDKYPQPKTRPPLFGLPVGVKDIFQADGFETRAGSNIPPKRLTGPEAPCVTALKNAGALIFGKTVTTEFAYFGPGPTRNPHNLAHTPGGSSSGSAAAVAAGMIPLATGTQTIGSINRPASFCGVVGYKPTYERISKRGVIPVSQAVDTVGYFTPDVALAQAVAPILCRGWQELPIPQTKPVLAIPAGPYLEKTEPEMVAHFEQTIEKLVAADYQVKWIPAMDKFDDIYTRHNQIVAYEAAQNHAHWLPEFREVLHIKTVDLIERGQNTKDVEYQNALIGREELHTELTTLMMENGIDLWLSPPALGPAPKGLDSTGDPIMNLPWTHCGFPTVTLPTGFNQAGLPMGIQVAGKWKGDEELLAGSLELEQMLAD
jgi:Asp-tRNA(Asn)/Glu-tRNA(Gln) amidotransferase A subunit family amidase